MKVPDLLMERARHFFPSSWSSRSCGLREEGARSGWRRRLLLARLVRPSVRRRRRRRPARSLPPSSAPVPESVGVSRLTEYIAARRRPPWPGRQAGRRSSPPSSSVSRSARPSCRPSVRPSAQSDVCRHTVGTCYAGALCRRRRRSLPTRRRPDRR